MTYLSLIPRRSTRRIFDDFFSGLDATFEGVPTFDARLDVSETDKAVTVTADLPGLEDKDIELTLDENVLSLKGEKKADTEEEGRNFFRKERTYGAFTRAIELPEGIDATKIAATFKNGVLTVTLPKSEKAKEETKRIPIKSA